MKNLNVKRVVTILAGVALISLGVTLVGIKVEGPKVFRDQNGIVAIKGEENIDETNEFNVENIKNINIDTVSDDVNIILSNDNKVKAHFYGTSSDKSKAPKLEATLSGGKLDIKIKYPKQIISLGNFNVSTKLDVYIPEMYKNDMAIETVSGEVNIDKLEADNFKVSTTSGDVDITSLTAKETNFDSTSGAIDIKMILAKSNEFETTSGNIKIESIDGNIKFNSVSGKINATFDEFNNDVYAETVSGDVRLTIPESSEFQIDFSTTSGELENDFPIIMTGKIDKRDIKGAVGNSENIIKIDTTSGDVSINKR